MEKFNVLGTEISFYGSKEKEFICLTDIAKHKDKKTDEVIKNWLRNKNTIEFLGIWEILHNSEFKPVEFDGFRSKAGLHGFVLTAKQWIEKTGALENLNALFIQEGISQKERLVKLNQIAIQQMKLLIEDRHVKRLV